MREDIFLGNEAIALGLLEGGCDAVTSYPGTPSSEILPGVVKLKKQLGLDVYTEWSTNEKVALDNAFSFAITGKRAACSMKQVGLNVAADSLMSAAYMGTRGALLIISCDDPGPHSSQTEQDSRIMARLAKVPVLDPSTPQEARDMARFGLDLSERFRIPVILRPTIRVCHARQNLKWDNISKDQKEATFEKDPTRWAATPRFRFILHGELNKKLKEIGRLFEESSEYNFIRSTGKDGYPLGIVAGGVSYAVVSDILKEEGRDDIPILKIGTPFPFPERLAQEFLSLCEKVLVVEETDTLIEYLLRDREKVLGRLTGNIPSQGELIPDIIYSSLSQTLEEMNLPPLSHLPDREVQDLIRSLELPIRRPTLCPGCPHRASFYAIRKALPKAIYTSDIGCYTLGLNMGAVDTCLDMGAAITIASGLYQSYSQSKEHKDLVATIGDSTFYHAGTAGLLNAVYNGSRFILVVLDNLTTAMTGMQPTPGLGIRADGSKGNLIELERVIRGCGIEFIEVVDPYDIKGMVEVLKRASEYVKSPDGGIAVIIARHPCVIAYRDKAIPKRKKIKITDRCVECNLCIERFECPALYRDEELGRTAVDPVLCTGCGVCIEVCPKGAIVEE